MPSAKMLDRPEPIYWEHEGHRAIRDGDWKLVSTYDRGHGPWELYNLADDPTETNDLAARHPDRVQRLESKWTTWAREANVLPDIFARRAANAKRKAEPNVP